MTHTRRVHLLWRTAMALLLATVLAAGQLGRTSSQAAATDQAAMKDTRIVTLITGDRVEVTTLADGRRTVRTIPGPGRAGPGFIEREVDGHLSVVPADAQSLLVAGRLDPRLFDVTSLLEERRDSTHLIIQYGSAEARSSVRAGLVGAGAKVTRELSSIGGAAVQVRSGFWSELTGGNASARSFGPGIAKVWLDGLRRTTLDRSVAQIGAPATWSVGLTGVDVPVAVVDTGIDATHPDLADRVKAARDFTGAGTGDRVGHGTHVASTIAGTAADSAGKYKGVAFGASLIDAKACEGIGCEESDILAAMEWAATEQHARIINLSLGHPDTPGTDPLEQAVDSLTAQTGALS